MNPETTTVGLFTTREDAEEAINELRDTGLPDNEISYVFVNDEGSTETRSGSGAAVGRRTMSGATTGGIVGALAGLAVANGILPGLGSLFVAGPLAAALGLTGAAATTAAGALTGAAAGGLIGALSGLGVSKDDAAMYEDRVKRGEILVVTRTGDTEVVDVFERNHARDVRQYAPA
jgi:hypothetical protein